MQKKKSAEGAPADNASHAPPAVRLVIEFRSQVEEITNEPTDASYQDDGVGWDMYVKLTNGKTYGCDFIVSATGVIPNTSFLGPEVCWCRGRVCSCAM